MSIANGCSASRYGKLIQIRRDQGAESEEDAAIAMAEILAAGSDRSDTSAPQHQL